MANEYERQRMLRAAEMLRATKLRELEQLVVCYQTADAGGHTVELVNRATKASERMTFVSALDVPSYTDFIESVVLKNRV